MQFIHLRWYFIS